MSMGRAPLRAHTLGAQVRQLAAIRVSPRALSNQALSEPSSSSPAGVLCRTSGTMNKLRQFSDWARGEWLRQAPDRSVPQTQCQVRATNSTFGQGPPWESAP